MTRPRAALSGAAADQFEIELCQPVEHGQHQTPVRGPSVGPCVGEGSKPGLLLLGGSPRACSTNRWPSEPSHQSSRRRGRSADLP